MEAAFVALIAVAGTLLGSALTHLLQARQSRSADLRTRADHLRKERIAIYSDFAGNVSQLRGATQFRQIMHEQHGPDSEEFVAARTETRRIQPIARAAMYRVHLVADDPGLVALSAEIVDVTNAIREAANERDMLALVDQSRKLTDAFIRRTATQLHSCALPREGRRLVVNAPRNLTLKRSPKIDPLGVG